MQQSDLSQLRQYLGSTTPSCSMDAGNNAPCLYTCRGTCCAVLDKLAAAFRWHCVQDGDVFKVHVPIVVS